MLVVAAAAGGGAYAWQHYPVQVRQVLGLPDPNDYQTTGNGQDVLVTIQSDETPASLAIALHDAGVTKTWSAFDDLLSAQVARADAPGRDVPPPGRDERGFGARRAARRRQPRDHLARDPGCVTSAQAFELIADTTGIAIADVKAAAADFKTLGLPAGTTSIEGWILPGTYPVNATDDAPTILKTLVTAMTRSSTRSASPRRTGSTSSRSPRSCRRRPDPADGGRGEGRPRDRESRGAEARPRLDATVLYGAGVTGTMWATPTQRADTSNSYNTYVKPGLPVGPISLPGEAALEAAVHPADGDWLYAVPVSMDGAAMTFVETQDEANAAQQRLFAWCDLTDEHAARVRVGAKR